MNGEPSGRRRHRYGRIRPVARRYLVGALLLFAVPIGSAAATLLLSSRSIPLAGIVKVGQILLLVLSPMLLFGVALGIPRGVRAVRRRIDSAHAETWPQPGGPPIEQIAADLRRLLRQHDVYARSNHIAMWDRRLWSLEVAISHRATQAARALGVPHANPPVHRGYDKTQLRWLLRALAAEGLVLPPAVALLAPEGGL
jgi:hypothetical protein